MIPVVNQNIVTAMIDVVLKLFIKLSAHKLLHTNPLLFSISYSKNVK
ncbi:uncharacterized protein METZ01_LOCUS304542 [marine metagenome]|uniref:Uncharacterized protein n=1 Tax=marine metagenome TaxID=408172 RepID=A0A382MTF5_9ZZZZ